MKFFCELLVEKCFLRFGVGEIGTAEKLSPTPEKILPTSTDHGRKDACASAQTYVRRPDQVNGVSDIVLTAAIRNVKAVEDRDIRNLI